MITEALQPENYRYERKFAISHLGAPELECIVRLHPAAFSEIYQPRYVNNIYFDTANRTSFHENLGGVSERIKTRIRWYGDLFGMVLEPVVELKIKKGLLGGKLRFPLEPFRLERGCSPGVTEIFHTEAVPESIREYLRTQECSLLNRYHRKYFQSFDRRFRITIDSGITAYRIDPLENRFLETVTDRRQTILELKYASDDEEGARAITNLLPFRITKSSKYVSGIENLNGLHP